MKDSFSKFISLQSRTCYNQYKQATTGQFKQWNAQWTAQIDFQFAGDKGTTATSLTLVTCFETSEILEQTNLSKNAITFSL